MMKRRSFIQALAAIVTVPAAMALARPRGSQTYEVTIPVTLDGGTYTLSGEHWTTGPLRFDATPEEVQAAINKACSRTRVVLHDELSDAMRQESERMPPSVFVSALSRAGY